MMFNDCKSLLYPQNLHNIYFFQVTWKADFISRPIDNRSCEYWTCVVLINVALSLIIINIYIVFYIVIVSITVTVIIVVLVFITLYFVKDFFYQRHYLFYHLPLPSLDKIISALEVHCKNKVRLTCNNTKIQLLHHIFFHDTSHPKVFKLYYIGAFEFPNDLWKLCSFNKNYKDI